MDDFDLLMIIFLSVCFLFFALPFFRAFYQPIHWAMFVSVGLIVLLALRFLVRKGRVKA